MVIRLVGPMLTITENLFVTFILEQLNTWESPISQENVLNFKQAAIRNHISQYKYPINFGDSNFLSFWGELVNET